MSLAEIFAATVAAAGLFANTVGPLAAPSMNGALVFDNPGLEASNPDGSGLRCLASDAAFPVWSPDGSTILFWTESGLETLRIATGAVKVVSRSVASPPAYSWSPDSRRIVYTQVRPSPGGFDLAVVDADGKHRHFLARGSAIRQPSEPAWAPRGGVIAFTDFEKAPPGLGLSSWESLFVVRTDGSGQRRVATNIDGTKPAWSPNGKLIAFVRHVGKYQDYDQVWVVRADGRSAHRVGPLLDSFAMSSPDWSPDGTRLAVEGESSSVLDDEELYILRPNVLDPKLLARGPSNLNASDADLNWVAWSPNGSTIATAFDARMVLVDAASGDARTIVDHGGNARWDPLSRTTSAFHGQVDARCVRSP